MKIIHKLYCSRCKVIDVPLIKNSRNKTKNGYTQYYYCRDCTNNRIKKYYQNNKEKVRAIIYKSVVKHQEKQNARMKVRYAVQTGKLEKPDYCLICGSADKRIEAHHKDYEKPLDIEWMCSSCHGDADKALRNDV